MAVTWAAQKQSALLRCKWGVEGQPRESTPHSSHTASSKSLKRLLCECTSVHTHTHTNEREVGWRRGYMRDGAPAASSHLFLLPAHWLMSRGETERGGSCTTGEKNWVTWECNPRQGKKINTLLSPSGCGSVLMCVYLQLYIHNIKLVCVYVSITFCCCQKDIFVPYCSLTSSLGNMSSWRTIKTLCQESVERQLNASSITLIDLKHLFQTIFLFLDIFDQFKSKL